jgi:hypothetical protein
MRSTSSASSARLHQLEVLSASRFVWVRHGHLLHGQWYSQFSAFLVLASMHVFLKVHAHPEPLLMRLMPFARLELKI